MAISGDRLEVTAETFVVVREQLIRANGELARLHAEMIGAGLFPDVEIESSAEPTTAG